MTINYVDRNILGSCPASVDMDTGVIEINKSVWNNFTKFEKKFIIEHEKAHYLLQTDDEYEADKYALYKLQGTEPKSLKKSIIALYKVGVFDESRLEKLYLECLKIDKKNKNKKMSSFQREHNYTEDYNCNCVNDQKEQKIFNFTIEPSNYVRSIHIANIEITFTEMILMAIAIILYKKLN